MMRFLLLLCLPLLAIAPATAQPESLPGILGQDDRVPTESLDWPWAAIGRVNRASGGYCTGTLVGPRQVLTAAHCLFDRAKRRIPARDIHFVAGYQRGAYLAHSAARDVILPEGYRVEAALAPEILAQDWAIIVLQDPIEIRPVPLRPLDGTALPGTATLMRAGYSQDRAHLLSVHEGCDLSGSAGDGRLLLHTCDATRGDSGSALLFRENDGIFIAGIEVGVIQSDRGDHGLGVSATGFSAVLDAALASEPVEVGR